MQRSDKQGCVEWIQMKEITPQTILSVLFQRNLQSVIIEGGKKVLESFITTNLWDEARVLIGKENFGEGLTAPEFPQHRLKQETEVGKDRLIVIRK